MRDADSEMLEWQLDLGKWVLRLFAWDGALPAGVLLIPSLVGLALPNNRGAIEITAVVLPNVAFFVRFLVGKRHIESNNCPNAMKILQLCVLCLCILLLLLVDAFVVLLHVMPWQAGGSRATTSAYSRSWLRFTSRSWDSRCTPGGGWYAIRTCGSSSTTRGSTTLAIDQTPGPATNRRSEENWTLPIRFLFDSVRYRVYNTVMKNVDGPLWTIEQLRDAVAVALGEGYTGPPNGRVRDVPDQRTIRYYTTLGLIDRAAEMRGRTAFYGRRHLLQLVAIKKLQAKGQTLAEVQRCLTGQTERALARLAEIDLDQTMAGAKRPPSTRREFWKEAPASREIEIVAHESLESALQPSDQLQTLQGVPLAENVTLLLASSRPLQSADIEALRSASRPLIDLLIKLDIFTPRGDRGPR